MRPFDLTQAEIRHSEKAYPGTMLVYTAAKTYGLDAATAKDVAQFIRVSSTEGQQPGRGNGRLAAGYVPIKDAGVTKPLYQQAQQVAAAVAAQKAPKTPGHHNPGGNTNGNPGGSHSGNPGITPPGAGNAPGTLPGNAPPGTAPSTAPSSSTTSPSAGTPPVTKAQVVNTADVSSKTAGALLIGLFVVAALAGLGVLAGRAVLWRRGLR
jgi:hypothetical protein